MEGALDDITVLDLGQVIGMPFCTMLLADMGAKVIKVESRERGTERMALGIRRERNGKAERVHAAQYRDRNKLGITLDLKQPAAVTLFKGLVKKADVVCENFSVGAMQRLGLGYEDCKRVNPRIVHASLTAFGQEGPYAKLRGYDMLSQAISGYMSINGFPEGPPTRSGQSISDYYAGMLCAFSIVSALRYRDRTGKGQHIDMAGTPIKMSETPGRIERLAPLPGEHNEEIFAGLLGHTKDELKRWQDEGVI
jgi:CoA:oxalate CoA-transferase